MFNRLMNGAGLAALALLLGLSASALAEKKQHSDAMTISEMNAVYAESTEKMNTVAHYRYDADFLKAYEADVQARGETVKQDMVICGLPAEGELNYDDALSYACDLIRFTFGTPQDELDQMGVYPTFYRYPYMDQNPEWEFYITPRRDCNIGIDHTYPDSGEYRVTFDAVTEAPISCIWYLEEGRDPDIPRWNESFRLADNPVNPAYELPQEDWDIDYPVYDNDSPISAEQALDIVRTDFMRDKAIDKAAYRAVFAEAIPYYDETTYEVDLLVRKDAPEAWAGQNYAYGIDSRTGEIQYRQISMNGIDEMSAKYIVQPPVTAFTQNSVKGNGLTWTIENLYFDGYLLALDVRTSPNDTQYAVCNDVLGDYADYTYADDARAEGYIPVGSYCNADARIDASDDIPSPFGGSRREGSDVIQQFRWLFTPDEAARLQSICLTCGVMETPGQLASEETYVLNLPEPAATTAQRITVNTEQVKTNRLREILLTQSSTATNIYLYIDSADYGPSDPLDFVWANHPDAFVFDTYDEQKQLICRTLTIPSREIDLTSGMLPLKDLENDQLITIDLQTGAATL